MVVEGHRQYNPGWHLALDLRNMLIVSECIAKAALAREEFTPDQLREIAIFLTHYVGWPRGAAFNNLVEDSIRQHKGSGSQQQFPGAAKK